MLPNLHLYIDDSGSMMDSGTSLAVAEALRHAYANRVGLYATFFAHEVKPELDGIELLSRNSASAFAAHLASLPRASAEQRAGLVESAVASQLEAFRAIPRSMGGTDLMGVIDLIEDDDRRWTRKNVIVSDMEFYVEDQRYKEVSLHDFEPRLAYLDVSVEGSPRLPWVPEALKPHVFRTMAEAIAH